MGMSSFLSHKWQLAPPDHQPALPLVSLKLESHIVHHTRGESLLLEDVGWSEKRKKYCDKFILVNAKSAERRKHDDVKMMQDICMKNYGKYLISYQKEQHHMPNIETTELTE